MPPLSFYFWPSLSYAGQHLCTAGLASECTPTPDLYVLRVNLTFICVFDGRLRVDASSVSRACGRRARAHIVTSCTHSSRKVATFLFVRNRSRPTTKTSNIQHVMWHVTFLSAGTLARLSCSRSVEPRCTAAACRRGAAVFYLLFAVAVIKNPRAGTQRHTEDSNKVCQATWWGANAFAPLPFGAVEVCVCPLHISVR